MKEYKKIIILSSVLLILIVLITLVMIFDVDLKMFKNLSIAGIGKSKANVESLIDAEQKEEDNLITAKNNIAKAKESFEEAKTTYNNIDESTIAIVQEATKNENYFIEYLWVVLGNYARANDLEIGIVTPGSTTQTNNSNNNTSTNTNTTVTTPTGESVSSNGTTNSTSRSEIADSNNSEQLAEESTSESQMTSSSLDNAIKISVKGRYSNVADFVFDVENDKELRFKLDNIKMTYQGNNLIEATFDVLSLNVKQ